MSDGENVQLCIVTAVKVCMKVFIYVILIAVIIIFDSDLIG